MIIGHWMQRNRIAIATTTYTFKYPNSGNFIGVLCNSYLCHYRHYVLFSYIYILLIYQFITRNTKLDLEKTQISSLVLFKGFVSAMSNLVINEPSPIPVGTPVTLISKENTQFQTTYGVIRLSKTITSFLTDVSLEDGLLIVPVPAVSDSALASILQYLKYHYETAEQYTRDWDCNFVNVPQSDLFDLIMAANYLDIPSLFDLTCSTVANMIKGKTPEELRFHFNIPNDFTPEEEEEVRRENAWAEEQVCSSETS
jgi:S-phase kinase-associated protein 1